MERSVLTPVYESVETLRYSPSKTILFATEQKKYTPLMINMQLGNAVHRLHIQFKRL